MSDPLNAALELLDRHVDQGRGDRTAVRCLGTVTTFRELRDLSAAFARGLRDLGTRTGERVLFVCSDRTELLAGILGALRTGAVAVPVSTMLNGPELAKLVADCGARVVVVTPEFTAACSEALRDAPEVAHVVTVGDAVVQVPGRVQQTSWDDLVQGGGDALRPTLADTPALWLYTSGTTGIPKGAMHRHANLLAVCETYADRVLHVTADDVFFSVAKLFFAYGLGNSALFPLWAGATTVLEPRRPSALIAAEVLREHRPTLFFSGPTFFAALLAADLPADTFASVRAVPSAGEALPATLQRRFTERFGVEVLDGIGSTEALHIFLSNQPGAARPGTSGVPVPGYDIALRDEQGQPVADGTAGALFVRGPSLATGYWCRTDASRAVFQGEWLCTGDTYVRSEDGWYTCLGRSGDLLKAGGIWVSPAEVEERLLQHPAVAEAAVVGVRDSDDLDKPVAYVVPAAGATLSEDELVAWCREGLAAFKRPRAVVVLDELPKTATGKVQRFRLKEAAQPLQTAVPAAEPVPAL